MSMAEGQTSMHPSDYGLTSATPSAYTVIHCKNHPVSFDRCGYGRCEV